MFKFKQFSLSQDRTPMKIGTDGVLIGAWAAVRDDDKYILDIGSGTGLIALMMAQRSNALIDAVEIDKESAEEAGENIAQSPWSKRVSIDNINIINFNKEFKYDVIVSNPPFFSDSLLSPSKGRSIARHTITLSFEELASVVERLLSCDGRFSIILPFKESEEFERVASGRLYLWRKCGVRSRVESDYKRVMCEYRLAQSDNIELTDFAIREAKSNDYTPEYINLTKDFYLKF